MVSGTPSEDMGIAHGIEGSEYHVDPTRDGDASVARQSERGQADVQPEESQERHRLLQKVAHYPVPREHRLILYVVVPLELYQACISVLGQKQQHEDIQVVAGSISGGSAKMIVERACREFLVSGVSHAATAQSRSGECCGKLPARSSRVVNAQLGSIALNHSTERGFCWPRKPRPPSPPPTFSSWPQPTVCSTTAHAPCTQAASVKAIKVRFEHARQRPAARWIK